MQGTKDGRGLQHGASHADCALDLFQRRAIYAHYTLVQLDIENLPTYVELASADDTNRPTLADCAQSLLVYVPRSNQTGKVRLHRANVHYGDVGLSSHLQGLTNTLLFKKGLLYLCIPYNKGSVEMVESSTEMEDSQGSHWQACLNSTFSTSKPRKVISR